MFLPVSSYCIIIYVLKFYPVAPGCPFDRVQVDLPNVKVSRCRHKSKPVFAGGHVSVGTICRAACPRGKEWVRRGPGTARCRRDHSWHSNLQCIRRMF